MVYTNTISHYVRAESNLDFNSLRKDEYIDLRAEETEIFHVTERFDAEGNYQIERISLTPEANRPGALRLSHKTVFDSDGHRFYDERGVLKRNLPITSLDEETLAALTGAWEASEGFPASELALPTSAQIEELEENGLTIDVLENGDIFMSADNQSIFLSASEPITRITSYDPTTGNEIVTTTVFEEIGNGLGRNHFEITREKKTLSNGQCYWNTKIDLRDYNTNGDAGRSSADSPLSAFPKEDYGWQVQTNGERSEALRLVATKIKTSTNTPYFKAYIYDVSRRKVKSFQSASLNEKLSVSELPRGVYVIVGILDGTKHSQIFSR